MELGQTQAPGDSPGTSGDELRIMKASDRPALTGCWAELMSRTAMGICSRKKRNPLWPQSAHPAPPHLSAQSSRPGHLQPHSRALTLPPARILSLHRPEVALGFSLSFLYPRLFSSVSKYCESSQCLSYLSILSSPKAKLRPFPYPISQHSFKSPTVCLL